MSKIKLEVLGPNPPCGRCSAVYAIAKKVAEEIDPANIEIVKVDAYSEEAFEKYNFVVTPALAVDGKVRIMGRIPSESEVRSIILEATGSQKSPTT